VKQIEISSGSRIKSALRKPQHHCFDQTNSSQLFEDFYFLYIWSIASTVFFKAREYPLGIIEVADVFAPSRMQCIIHLKEVEKPPPFFILLLWEEATAEATTITTN
jgi:hypothetical protein